MSRTFRIRGGSGVKNSFHPLGLDEIREYAPSVFATAPHDSRSDRYRFVPTSEIVTALAGLNYGVMSAQQSGSRSDDKRGHTKHMLRFRPLGMAPLALDGVFPEIVLVNSHDGSSAYQLHIGLFRLICTNGMIASDGQFSRVSIRHNRAILDDVCQAVTDIAARMPAVLDRVGEFRGITLSYDERVEFAREALAVKYPTTEEAAPGSSAAPIEPRVILIPKRQEDAAPSLWNVLNVIQENLMAGGQRYDTRPVNGQRPQRRRTGGVNSISGNLSINQAVWEIARRMAEARMSV